MKLTSCPELMERLKNDMISPEVGMVYALEFSEIRVHTHILSFPGPAVYRSCFLVLESRASQVCSASYLLKIGSGMPENDPGQC